MTLIHLNKTNISTECSIYDKLTITLETIKENDGFSNEFDFEMRQGVLREHDQTSLYEGKQCSWNYIRDREPAKL